MKEELRNKLVDDHPLLYRSTFYFECGDGWFKLLYKLSDKIEKEIKKYIEENKNNCECGCDLALHKNGKCSTVYENGIRLPNGTYEDVPCSCDCFTTIHPRASQVKEKYGTLNYYMDFETDKIYKLIDKAEDQSCNICEECGKRGWYRDNPGWVRTLCDKHCIEYYGKLIPHTPFLKRIRNKVKWYFHDLRYKVIHGD